MKVISILGSPREKGNTVKVLDWVEDELRSLGHEVDRVNVVDHTIGGCLGCRRCQDVLDDLGCAQDDDAQAIFQRMMAADIILWASPLFWWDFPSQLKALVDRQYCFVTGYGGPSYRSLAEGKKSALLVTCDGAIEENANLIVEVFRRMSAYLKIVPVADLVVPFCYMPDQPGDEAKTKAETLARQIVA